MLQKKQQVTRETLQFFKNGTFKKKKKNKLYGPLLLILSTSEGWKAELTLEPQDGFEHGTPGLGIQQLNQSKLFPLIWSKFIFNTDKSKCAYSRGTDGIKCGNYFKCSVTKFQLLKQYTSTNDALCLWTNIDFFTKVLFVFLIIIKSISWNIFHCSIQLLQV